MEEVKEEINTHGMLVDFGKYKDQLYTRIPVGYLKWMVQCSHSRSEIAKAELKRRGTVTPTLEVSGHAIDSASLRLRWYWHETAKSKDEGLHAWLVRMSQEALLKGKMDEEGRVFYGKMKFVFENGEWPVLKTCMPTKERKDEVSVAEVVPS